MKNIIMALFSDFLKNNQVKKFNVYKDDILLGVNKFNSLDTDKYFSSSDKDEIENEYKHTYELLKKLKINDKIESYDELCKFLEVYKNLGYYIDEYNRKHYDKLKEENKDLLSNIDGKSLDEQQRDVVVNQNDRCLVVAGAGSGKTLTVSGKVKYLCEVDDIKPEDILLISFTKKASEEMTKRIKTKLGLNVQATTFHKLGLDILKASSGTTYDVVDSMEEFLNDYFKNRVADNKKVLGSLMRYFAYYLQIPADMDEAESLGDVYDQEKTADLETIKSKYTAATYVEKETIDRKPNKQTLKNEEVKSLEEVIIANFLFLHGIEYEYESEYPFQDKESNRRKYKPDFYLPEYNLYIEHFGINKEGRCPQYSEIEEKKYLNDMKWKVEWHKKHETSLIQTYSYYQSEGVLESKLEEELLGHGVKFREVDLAEIFTATYINKEEKYFSEFMKLCSTFVSLFKSNGFREDELFSLNYKSDKYNSRRYYLNKRGCFLEIMEDLLSEYRTYLAEKNAYDFADMINLSTKAVNEGFKVQQYKYVIIDEFQDISAARFNLIKAILNQTGAKLLCVGDDWQSIYRFAGSDISIFTDFNKEFKDSDLLKIEKTYRNSQQLITETGNFVMCNPQQIKKDLKSDKSLNKPLVFNFYGKNNKITALQSAIDSICKEFGVSKNIMLLGRTNFDFDEIKESGLFYGKSFNELHYRKYPDIPISFLTVHKSKGLEADNVILLNFENSTLGFPNKIADDPILELVLSDKDGYAFGEERRLLYVALTRTKNKTYVLVPENKPSIFIKEFKENESVEYIGKSYDESEVQLCPKCKTGKLVKRIGKDGHEYMGCSNYPKCDYTVQSVKAVENKRVCPECGGFLELKAGKYGTFYGCSNYPQCNYKEKIKTKACPECGGILTIRKGKYGFFYGCSNYPKCKHIEKCNE